MKKMITIAAIENGAALPDDILFEGAEIIKPLKDESADSFFKRYFKCADGKYTAFVDAKINLYDFFGFLNALDRCASDAVTFNGGIVFKTSAIKGVNFIGTDARCAEICALCECKSIAKTDVTPYSPIKFDKGYSDEYEKCVYAALNSYSKSKSKVPKEVYSTCFDLLVSRVSQFLAAQFLGLREGSAKVENAEKFYEELKKHTVLYHAVDKKLDIKGGLEGVKKDKFKISSGLAKKLAAK